MDKQELLDLCDSLNGYDPLRHIEPPIFRFPTGSRVHEAIESFVVFETYVAIKFWVDSEAGEEVVMSISEAALLLTALSLDTKAHNE